jgi:hypothetical protein
MTREKMFEILCNAYGLEHPFVIFFAGLMEEYEENPHNEKCLLGIFEAGINLIQYASEME